MTDPVEPALADNEDEARYELRLEDDLVGVLHYRDDGDARVLVHTEIEPGFEGRGLGGVLVSAVLDDLRERNLKMVPVCRFVRSYLERHPERA